MASAQADSGTSGRGKRRPGEAQLRRTLSLGSLVALGIGCTIGAGIFVLTGHVAAANAGPAISLSFVLAGIVCAFAGLCYAEMASTLPIAGSAYTYAYATMGEFIAWVTGWNLILEYTFGATTVAIGWLGLPGDTWLRLVVWLVIGLAIYFLYGRNHSHWRQKSAEFRL